MFSNELSVKKTKTIPTKTRYFSFIISLFNIEFIFSDELPNA